MIRKYRMIFHIPQLTQVPLQLHELDGVLGRGELPSDSLQYLTVDSSVRAALVTLRLCFNLLIN